MFVGYINFLHHFVYQKNTEFNNYYMYNYGCVSNKTDGIGETISFLNTDICVSRIVKQTKRKTLLINDMPQSTVYCWKDRQNLKLR